MAPLLRSCSGLVIRCFKHVEAFADWITGAAGPVFVFLCWSLIGLGGFVFCERFHYPLPSPATVFMRRLSC
jgi:palmitoyltransferase